MKNNTSAECHKLAKSRLPFDFHLCGLHKTARQDLGVQPLLSEQKIAGAQGAQPEGMHGARSPKGKERECGEGIIAGIEVWGNRALLHVGRHPKS